MLRVWGSWDADFIAVTARVRERLLAIIDGQDSHAVVLLQGSGAFSGEAAVATVMPFAEDQHAPVHAAYDFKRFYAAAKSRGFLLYPGKLTEVDTFRVGCIGAIGPNEMRQAVAAVAQSLAEMGIAHGSPAH